MLNLNKKFILNNNTISVRRNTSGLFPTMKTKIFLPNPDKVHTVKKPTITRKNSIVTPRYNQMGVQMLSQKIYDQVFIEGNISKNKPAVVIEQCKNELRKHNMITKKENVIKDVEFKIPPLLGKNIEEHFEIIGEEQARPYRDLVLHLLNGIPQPPDKWVMQEGWTKYTPGNEPEQVQFPLEEILVFDVEESIIVICKIIRQIKFFISVIFLT